MICCSCVRCAARARRVGHQAPCTPGQVAPCALTTLHLSRFPKGGTQTPLVSSGVGRCTRCGSRCAGATRSASLPFQRSAPGGARPVPRIIVRGAQRVCYHTLFAGVKGVRAVSVACPLDCRAAPSPVKRGPVSLPTGEDAGYSILAPVVKATDSPLPGPSAGLATTASTTMQSIVGPCSGVKGGQ